MTYNPLVPGIVSDTPIIKKSISASPITTAVRMVFACDGDGRRVKSEKYVNDVSTETILFVGAHYEINVTTNQVTKYYLAGTSRIAMRKYVIPQSMSVEYLLSDHLGSTSLTTDSAGEKISEMRYKPWGEARYSWTSETLTSTPTYEMTKYQFTGQFSYEAEFGLLFYNARMYDPYLNHFTQPDTIVPDPYNSQDYDRYAYARNNPLKYTDPTGHDPDGNCYDKGYCGNDPDLIGKPCTTCHSRSDSVTPTPTPTNTLPVIATPTPTCQPGPRNCAVSQTQTAAPTTTPTSSDCTRDLHGGCAYSTSTPFARDVVETAVAHCSAAPDGSGAKGCGEMVDLAFQGASTYLGYPADSIPLAGGAVDNTIATGYFFGDLSSLTPEQTTYIKIAAGILTIAAFLP